MWSWVSTPNTHSTALHRNSFVTRSLFLYVWILMCVCLIIFNKRLFKVVHNNNKIIIIIVHVGASCALSVWLHSSTENSDSKPATLFRHIIIRKWFTMGCSICLLLLCSKNWPLYLLATVVKLLWLFVVFPCHFCNVRHLSIYLFIRHL